EPVMRLGKVADLEPAAQLHLAGDRLELAQHGAQEGGLARTIGADQRHALPPLHLQVSGGKQSDAGVPDLQARRTQHDSVAPPGRFQAHAQHRRTARGRLDLLDTAVRLLDAHHVDAVHARLCPAFALKAQDAELLDGDKLTAEALELAFGLVEFAPGEVAPDQLDLLLQALPLRLEQRLVALPALLPLVHVGAIGAAVALDVRGAHLPDAVDHPLEEA